MIFIKLWCDNKITNTKKEAQKQKYGISIEPEW